jgi:hypothetical protein
LQRGGCAKISGLRRMLMKPGPATSAAATVSVSTSAQQISTASSPLRGV